MTAGGRSRARAGPPPWLGPGGASSPARCEGYLRSHLQHVPRQPDPGSPRIVGELRELGSEVAKATVEKYMVRRRRPPSPRWRRLLANHAKELVFTVPTVRFEVLFVLIILAHDRRRVVHFNITEYPTAQQVVEAFPWDTAPRFLLRDRDSVYGANFRGPPSPRSLSPPHAGSCRRISRPSHSWESAPRMS